MRYSRIFLALTLAAILSLLAIAIPASPALAAEDVDLDPNEGEIGDRVEVDGDDFDASTESTTVYITIYFSSEEADVDDDIDDDVENYEVVKSRKSVNEYGDFDTSFYVPSALTDGDDDEDVHGGTYYVYVTYKDNDNIEAMAGFTVIAGTIELDTEEGTVGTEVEISGSYFDGNDDITVTFDDVDITDEIEGDTDTDSDGDFTCTILIPEGTVGDHTIAVEDEHDHIAEATFTVEAEITLSPTSGSAGDRARVNGSGFGGRKDVTITFDGTRVVTVETDSDGSFTATFDVPDMGAGTYDVEAEDEDDNSDTAEFTVAAGISLSTVTTEDSPGYVGMEMTMSGTGFIPNAPVTITYTTEPVVVATTASDANGEFSAAFTIPPSEGGEHIITASDGTNSLTSTFIMESTAPPTPSPLLPEMGVKAERPVHFDWDDVEDPSGVTYTLNIATDADFTSASIVLEKEGLTSSEHIIATEEKLASTKKEAPYYWRVKAIDGASNESEWSGTGSFYVGGFAFPGGSIHLWWGLGAGGAGALGFFLGKRKSYYY